jgi:DNA polymerase-3 subunit beta
MELKIEARVLNRLVARCAPATADKSPMSMLRHLLFVADASGQLRCVGTDLILSVVTTAQCEVSKPGSFAVLAREFAERVKRLPGPDVSMSTKGGQLEIRSGKTRFKLPYAEAEDYPQIPSPVADAKRLRIQSRELSRLLQQTAYARSTDESRAHIACVRLEHAAGVATAVATDGTRLAISTAKVEGDDWGHNHFHSRAVVSVQRLCEEFGDETVAVSAHGGLEGHLFLEWPTVTLIARDAGTNFVPWQKIAPTSFERVAELDRHLFVEAIRRVALASDGKQGAIRVELSAETVTLSAASDDRGEAFDEVAADYSGDEAWFGVRASLMVDALSSMIDDRVLMKMNDELGPILITGSTDSSCVAVVMPYRLQVK